MKFGFIGFGEVSYTLSKILLSYGFDVLTSTEGRSKKTKELVKSLNLTVLDSFEEVAHQSDILISANSPQSALAVALPFPRAPAICSAALSFFIALTVGAGPVASIILPAFFLFRTSLPILDSYAACA